MATPRFWLAMTLGLIAPWATAAPVGTAFTYQGELRVSGTPANAAFDFEFALFNVANVGSAIATVARDDVSVANGLFTVELDYTDVPFAAAQEYFLEVRVRDGASVGGYQQLLPRQKITPAPYAVAARTVQANGVNQLAIAAGAVGNAQLQAAAVGSNQLDNLAVTSAKVADAAITSAKIADTSITDAKIADATISAAKLAFTPGDISAVVAGNGLTGGGPSGIVELAVDTGAIQARVTGTCAVGQYFRGIAVDGTVACDSLLTYLGIKLITAVDDPVDSVGSYTAITIGADGLPVIAYRDNTAFSLKVAQCANAACTGVATVTTVDDPVDQVGSFPSIAIGGDALPVISYWDATARALKVAKCSAPDCSGIATITTVDGPPTHAVDKYSAIVIGGDGLPLIAYRITTGPFQVGSLLAAKCTNADCTGAATIITVDDPVDDVGGYVTMALGNDQLPVIGYTDVDIQTLKVAKCTSADCSGLATITTVDDPANLVGSYADIAVGADGLPLISYWDSSANTLKVAKCANAACTGTATITTVDDPANNVGQFNAIAIGSDGLPVISYADITAGTLKVLKCGNQSCQ